MPLFSVIIPSYNRRELVEQSLRSIWRQTFTDYEVILVDDGSTDGTVEWARSQGERVRVVSQLNRGPGSARNLGVAHARGRYLAFLDSDDLWFDWSLLTYSTVIERAKYPAFVTGTPCRFGSAHELAAVTEEPLKFGVFRDYLASSDNWCWWGTSSFVIRRDAFVAAGGFNENWVNGEDADLALRLGIAEGFVHITAPVTFGYREHSQSAVHDLARTMAGAIHEMRSEHSGSYTGGPERAMERRRIICRQVRPVALACIRHGMVLDGWKAYCSTLRWHCTERQWKFVLGFPMIAVAACLRGAMGAAGCSLKRARGLFGSN